MKLTPAQKPNLKSHSLHWARVLWVLMVTCVGAVWTNAGAQQGGVTVLPSLVVSSNSQPGPGAARAFCFQHFCSIWTLSHKEWPFTQNGLQILTWSSHTAVFCPVFNSYAYCFSSVITVIQLQRKMTRAAQRKSKRLTNDSSLPFKLVLCRTEVTAHSLIANFTNPFNSRVLGICFRSVLLRNPCADSAETHQKLFHTVLDVVHFSKGLKDT